MFFTLGLINPGIFFVDFNRKYTFTYKTNYSKNY